MKEKTVRWATVVVLAATSGAGIAATLSTVPQSNTVVLGETSSFTIRIDGLGDQSAPSLGAYDIAVDYDGSIIAIDGISFGSQLGGGDDSVQRADSSEDGTLRVQEVSLVDPETLNQVQEGGFDLVTVELEAVGLGISELEVANAVLGDELGIAIDDVRRESASVEVVLVDPEDPRLGNEPGQLGDALVNACSTLATQDAPLTAGQQGLLDTCNGLIEAPVDERISLLDQATPRIVKPAARVGIATANQQFANIALRLTELRGGTVGVLPLTTMLEIDGQLIGEEQLAAVGRSLTGGGASSDAGALGGRWGFFLNGNIGTGDREQTDLERGFDFDLYNITAGADYRVTDKLIAGAAIGYGKTDADFDGSPDDTEVDGWTGLLYGLYLPTEAAYVDATISFNSNDYDIRRRDPFSGLIAESDTEGDSFAATLGGGYEFNRDQWTFGPYARLSYVTVDVDGYQESPVAGNEYRFEDQEADSFTSNLGGRVSYAISTPKGVVLPTAWLDWTHEFSNDAETITARLVNDPTNTPIFVRTDDPDRDLFHVGVGVSAQFAQGRSAYVFYERLFGHRYLDSGTLQAGLRLEF